jgi:DNA-binding NarL/FixJ family response regulator
MFEVLIRERFPKTGVVLLSQYLEPRYAERLLADQPAGLGYLLKERVSDVAVLIDALRRVTEDECVIKPKISLSHNVAHFEQLWASSTPLGTYLERPR